MRAWGGRQPPLYRPMGALERRYRGPDPRPPREHAFTFWSRCAGSWHDKPPRGASIRDALGIPSPLDPRLFQYVDRNMTGHFSYKPARHKDDAAVQDTADNARMTRASNATRPGAHDRRDSHCGAPGIAGSSCATTTSHPCELGLLPTGSGHIERPMVTHGIGSGIPIRGRMGSGDMYAASTAVRRPESHSLECSLYPPSKSLAETPTCVQRR